MRLHVRTSTIFKFESARLGSRLYFFENHWTLQLDLWRTVVEIIAYRKTKHD